MLNRLKEDWRHLKHGEPGQRFKDRYYLSQRRNRSRITFWRVFNIGAGSGIALGGLLMVIAPGPGWLAIFLGLGMLSGELLPVARILDRIEVQLRKLVRWLREAWNNTPVVGKALILLAILTVVAASVYGVYHFLFGVE
jgi:Putative transmembrane protein (PGPGW)